MVEDEEMEASGVSGNEEEMVEEAEGEPASARTDLSQKRLGPSKGTLTAPEGRVR